MDSTFHRCQKSNEIFSSTTCWRYLFSEPWRENDLFMMEDFVTIRHEKSFFLSPLELIIDMLSIRLFRKINKHSQRTQFFSAVGNFETLWLFEWKISLLFWFGSSQSENRRFFENCSSESCNIQRTLIFDVKKKSTISMPIKRIAMFAGRNIKPNKRWKPWLRWSYVVNWTPTTAQHKNHNHSLFLSQTKNPQQHKVESEIYDSVNSERRVPFSEELFVDSLTSPHS